MRRAARATVVTVAALAGLGIVVVLAIGPAATYQRLTQAHGRWGQAAAFEDRAREVAGRWAASPEARVWATGLVVLERPVREPDIDTPTGKEDLLSGRWRLEPGAPPAPSTRVVPAASGPVTVPLLSAEAALSRLVDAGYPAPDHTASEVVRLVARGVEDRPTQTSRGLVPVPWWIFDIPGNRQPLAVLAADPLVVPVLDPSTTPALARTETLPLAPLHGPAVTKGSSVTLRVWVGACDQAPEALVWVGEGFAVVAAAVRLRPGTESCTAQAIETSVTFVLPEPAGERLLLDAATGRPPSPGS